MSIYQVRTFAEILATIREEMQFSSSDTTKLNRVKRDVNAILNEIAAEKNWWWLQGSVSLQLPAFISSGTATVTAGSSGVTLTVAPAASMNDYWFAVDGFQEVYRVESHTAGALTLKLDGLFAGSTSSTATYKLWKDRIPLPTDCKETLSVYHEYFSTNLDAKGLQEFRRITALNPRAEGKPAYYFTGDFKDPSQTSTITSLPAVSTRASTGPIKTLVFASGLPTSVTSASSAGDPMRLRIQGAGDPSYNGDVLVSTVTTTSVANDTLIYTGKGELQESAISDSSISVTQLDQEVEYDRYRELFLYPCLNTSRVLIHVDYIKQVLPLNNDSDEPVIPLEDRMVLVYGALSRAWSRDRNPDEAARNLGMYKNKLAKMAGKMQDSQESPRFAVNKEYLRSKRNISMRGGLNGFAPPLSGSGASGSSVVTGTANSAAVFNTSGELVASSAVSDTEVGYLDGVTSAIQTQIDAKASLASPTFTGTVTAPTFVGNLTGNVTGNVTGNADTVTTNANLTGVITSVGNATAIASQTGTGTKFVVDTSPTLVTPVIGAATGTSLSVSGQLTSTVATGTAPLVVSSTTQVANLKAATAGNADTVTTNANLTGDVTSVGNATTLTNAPVIAKVLTGYTSGAGTVSATDSILQAIQKLNGNDATNANLTGDVTSVGNTTTYNSVVSKAKGGTGADNSSVTFPSTGTVQATTPNNHGILVSGAGATATVVAPNASTAFPLISGGASADPAWAKLSEAGGGTNQTAYTQGDILYASAANTLSKLAVGSNATFLTSNGTVPSWGSVANTIAVSTKTGNYTATTSDDLLLGNTNAFTFTLPAASAAAGKILRFQKIGSDTNAVSITRAGSDTIQGSTTLKLTMQYEELILVSDGTATWYIQHHDYPRTQTLYTPTYTGFGTVSTSEMYWSRVGDSMLLQGYFTSGTSTAVTAKMTLPSVFTSAGSDRIVTTRTVGFGSFSAAAAGVYTVLAPQSSSFVDFGFQGGSTSGANAATGSALIASGQSIYLTATLPITDWF